MRPALLLAACEMFDADPATALPQALAVELFHNFTLIHDDIMDQAPTRRGQATIHTKWNEPTAILAGDVMLVKAYEYLVQASASHLPALLRLFNETAVQVCEGQQKDMNFERKDEVSEEEYLDMIEQKTAVLLAAALQMGAMLAGAGASDGEHLYRFGLHIGIAFQLQDDWLDTFGNELQTGKQTGGDIIQNKKTFLWIEAMNRAESGQKRELLRWKAAPKADATQKVRAVKEIFQQLDIDRITRTTIDRHREEALRELALLQVPEDRKAVLHNLSGLLSRRDY